MTLDTLHLVLLVLALAGIGLAVWARQGAAPRLARLGAELDSAREERARATGEHERTVAALRADREAEGAAFKVETGGLRARAEAAELRIEAQDAAMRERQAGFEREREQFEKLQLETGQRFKSIADSALVESQKRFVELADETFKKHKEGAQGELGAMLKPIQETFGQFREKVEAIEKVRTEDRAQLTEQLRQVGETARLTHEVTGKLQTALAAPKGGGRWGEETLRNVLEMAGLSPYADFVEQASSDTEKGRQRPDVIVRMPGGRELVIDSKVSLEDYLAGCNPYRDRLFFPLPVTILSDLKMPGADGFSLLRWVKTRPELRHLILIVMTNSAAREDVDLSYELGANFFLTKPTRFHDLVSLVTSVVHWLRLNRYQAESTFRRPAPGITPE